MRFFRAAHSITRSNRGMHHALLNWRLPIYNSYYSHVRLLERKTCIRRRKTRLRALSHFYIGISCVESLTSHVRAKRCLRQFFFVHGSARNLAHVVLAVAKLRYIVIIVILHFVVVIGNAFLLRAKQLQSSLASS